MAAITENFPANPSKGGFGGPARATLWLNRYSARWWLRWLLPVLLAGLGAYVCIRSCQGQDWSLVAHSLLAAGPSVIFVMMAPLVGNFVHMLGWRSLLEPSMQPGLGRAFCIFVAAQAGNEVGASVLGESLKIAAFAAAQRQAALRAVLWDNLTSLVALGVVLLSVSALPLREELHLTPSRIALLGLTLFTVTAIGLWLTRRFQTNRRPPWRCIAFAFLAHYLGKIWIVAEYALCLSLIATASFHNSALLGFASMLGTSLGAPVPGQLGVVEAALVSCAGVAQLTLPTLLGVAILRRTRSLVWVLLGAILGIFVGVITTRKTPASPRTLTASA